MADINQDATDLRNRKVDMLTTKNIDMKQRRVINAAQAIDIGDYVTLGQLNNVKSNLVGTTSASVLIQQSLKTYTLKPQARITDLEDLKQSYELLRLAYEDIKAKLVASGLFK